jgi:hypothetical protein
VVEAERLSSMAMELLFAVEVRDKGIVAHLPKQGRNV